MTYPAPTTLDGCSNWSIVFAWRSPRLALRNGNGSRAGSTPWMATDGAAWLRSSPVCSSRSPASSGARRDRGREEPPRPAWGGRCGADTLMSGGSVWRGHVPTPVAALLGAELGLSLTHVLPLPV